MNAHRLIVAAGGVALGGLAMAGVLAATNPFADAVPSGTGARVVNQQSSASADGITLSLQRATFSGSETAIDIAVTIGGEQMKNREVQVPAGAMASTDFAGTSIGHVAYGDASNIIIELPPLAHGGTSVLVFHDLVLRESGGRKLVSGPWALTLAGPTETEFARTMSVEKLNPAVVTVGGASLTVSGERSLSRTIVEYALPPSLRELAPPRLRLADGRLVQPVGYVETASARRAIFPVTPFGQALMLAFGPFGQDAAGAVTVKVNLEDALQRAHAAGNTNGEVLLLTSDVVDGPADIPIAFTLGHEYVEAGQGRPMDFGRRQPLGDIDTLRVRVRGSWHLANDPANPSPYASTPGVLDRNGVPLRQLSVSTGYSKTAAGDIQEGETDWTVYVEPGSDISRVTLVLGAPSRVLSGNWTATIAP